MLDSNNLIENSDIEDVINRKKYLIIIGVLVMISLIIMVFIAIALRSNNSPQISNVEPSPTIIPLPSPSISIIIPTYPPTPIPQPDDIIIDGIAVNNFKENSIRTLENGDLVLSENLQYQIIFNEPNQKFTLRILEENFELAQRNAEDELIRILGLDEMNMCRMYIEVEVSNSVNNEQRGKVYPFSRCIHEAEM